MGQGWALHAHVTMGPTAPRLPPQEPPWLTCVLRTALGCCLHAKGHSTAFGDLYGPLTRSQEVLLAVLGDPSISCMAVECPGLKQRPGGVGQLRKIFAKFLTLSSCQCTLRRNGDDATPSENPCGLGGVADSGNGTRCTCPGKEADKGGSLLGPASVGSGRARGTFAVSFAPRRIADGPAREQDPNCESSRVWQPIRRGKTVTARAACLGGSALLSAKEIGRKANKNPAKTLRRTLECILARQNVAEIVRSAGGAISATKACFPDAALHRDLEHIKKDVKRTGSMKKVDSELTMEITEIIQFSAKVAHPLQFHVIWDTLRRLRDPEDWNQAQERAWRSIKGLFKKGFRHQDASQLVRETALTLQTLVRGGNQSHRLTLDLMQQWREKEGDENTFLKYDTAARVLVDRRTVDVTSLVVMPKYKLEYAKSKKRDMDHGTLFFV
ncbi:unnamed protein product [Symbiodinium microadriaticum]|nr:unnamed protein product [Symbiodinium microadriaticum]